MNIEQLSGAHRRLCDDALRRLDKTDYYNLPSGKVDNDFARKLQAAHLIETLTLIESLVATVKSGLTNHSAKAIELCLEIINRCVALAAYCESLEACPDDR